MTLVVAIAVGAALTGCTAVGSVSGAPAPSTSPSSTPPPTVSASGTGWTPGAKTGPAPLSLTVPTPAGTHGIDVTITCPGSGAWIATNATSSITREGTCGRRGPTLVPVSGTPSSVTLDVSAATDGQKLAARASSTTARFHQVPTLAAFCKAYSVPDSTLYNADLSYQKHLSTAAQWQHSRSEGASQLGTLIDATGTPGWAANTIGAIRTAVLTAAPGTASQADPKDTQAITTACQNNSSTLTVTVTVPGQG